MADSGGEKKYAPTPRRRQRAREEGNVARSQDLTSAVLLLTAIAALWMSGGHLAAGLANGITDSLSTSQIQSYEIADASNTLLQSAIKIGAVALPLMVALLAMGVLVNVTQTGFLIVPSKLAPSFDNINPVTGAKRITSMRSTARLGFGLVKVTVVCAVAYGAVQHYGSDILHLAGMPVPQVVRTLFDCLMGTVLAIGCALFALALLDYGFQWWRHERDLMMTDDELREEMKEAEGDPEIANRRRQIQRGPAETKRGANISNADLVITGPSGVAIALQYNPMTMAAPVVIAKGRGRTSETIRSGAARSGVLVVERPLLAEHQYRTTELGAEIGADQYQAVAQLLRRHAKHAA